MAKGPRLRDAGNAIVVMTRKFGLRRAMWLLEFTAAWAIALRANGWEPIDAEQYGAYWKMGRAQCYRDQRKWRELFPDEPTPTARILAQRKEYERLIAETQPAPDPTREKELLTALLTHSFAA